MLERLEDIEDLMMLEKMREKHLKFKKWKQIDSHSQTPQTKAIATKPSSPDSVLSVKGTDLDAVPFDHPPSCRRPSKGTILQVDMETSVHMVTVCEGQAWLLS
jgi:hypothetical protein